MADMRCLCFPPLIRAVSVNTRTLLLSEWQTEEEFLNIRCRHAEHLPGCRKSGVKVCGVPRSWVVVALGLLGLLLLQQSRALLTLAWSLSIGKTRQFLGLA